ncbi:sensor histidine kinase [Micromonospora polyrhachis]|uniref:histidine kinase n=1 Tax=Micromonospora polyrhachis TaxID=1282883 RepID=A0A7W7WP13_9ACTN|nr:nitrate- and nitrite sensing domain-containing protein [Micromonospora polyrhachis]MBB4958202.1 signal transduction histidine kinase [Micromonospora polyrhachis]
MSTGPTTLPENASPEHGARRRWFPRLRDAKIRSKLALILVVPLATVLALAAIRLVSVGQGALDANQARALTELSADVSALTQDVHKERMAAASFLATRSGKPDAYNLRIRSTDERINAYTAKRSSIGDLPGAVDEQLKLIDAHLTALTGARQEVLDRKQMPVAEAVLRYGVILTDLVAYSESLSQLPGTDSLVESRRAVAAFARAKSATAEEEAVTFAALTGGKLDDEQFSSFVATLTSQQEALLSFSLAASPQQQALVNSTVTGDAIVLADRVSSDVTRSVGQNLLVTAADAANSIGAVNDLMRWAEIQLENQLLAQTDEVRSAVIQQAITETVLVLLILAIAIALAVVLARSLNDSLRRLREGALSVANHDLPEAVARLRDVGNVGDGGVEEIVRQVRDPIRLSNKDEIGQVAAAFNVVHKEAVRVAAEQAALRTSVSAMFLNLARRSQALVDRMIGELDMIERGEEDPKRLAQLFELDHLATRMRRNDENLLVLAGADSTVPRRDDALLVDVLRASQSEVELYNRIEFGTVDTDISVAAHAVNDVVRLVAELLDNATRFSAPNTAVVADARRIRDYVLIQVEDRGLGLRDDQLEALNRRLAAPPTVDVAAFRLMGLAVVSRLASRHNIRVELRRNIEGGTVAQVTLPAGAVVLPKPQARELISRPRQPLAVEPGPAAGAPSAGAPAAANWSEPMGAGRAASATLSDNWRDSSSQWQTTSDQSNSAFQVNTAGQTASQPVVTPMPPSAPVVQTPPPAAQPSSADTGFGTPTMAYPTLRPLPQRGGTDRPMPSATPSAGLPAGPVAGPAATPAMAPAAAPPAPPRVPTPPASGATPGPAESGDSPIFREMETAWFRSHGQDATEIFTMPPIDDIPPPKTATTAPAAPVRRPLPARTPGESAPPPYTPPAAATSAPGPSAGPDTRTGAIPTTPAAPAPGQGGNAWRTAADEGWARATQAAEPAAAGTTRSGLPKRVPQAQLVPGGVAAKPRERARRTPDEVRGLLSAYHRGVQRGRSVNGDPNGTSTKETSE